MKVVLASLVCGLATGVLSGLLGVGGGILLVPLLVAVVGMSQHQAHATSLAAIIPIAAVSGATYALHGEVDPTAAALLAAGALVGSQVGAKLMSMSTEGLLKLMFAALMVAVGIQMLWP